MTEEEKRKILFDYHLDFLLYAVRAKYNSLLVVSPLAAGLLVIFTFTPTENLSFLFRIVISNLMFITAFSLDLHLYELWSAEMKELEWFKKEKIELPKRPPSIMSTALSIWSTSLLLNIIILISSLYLWQGYLCGFIISILIFCLVIAVSNFIFQKIINFQKQ